MTRWTQCLVLSPPTNDILGPYKNLTASHLLLHLIHEKKTWHTTHLYTQHGPAYTPTSTHDTWGSPTHSYTRHWTAFSPTHTHETWDPTYPPLHSNSPPLHPYVKNVSGCLLVGSYKWQDVHIIYVWHLFCKNYTWLFARWNQYSKKKAWWDHPYAWWHVHVYNMLNFLFNNNNLYISTLLFVRYITQL